VVEYQQRILDIPKARYINDPEIQDKMCDWILEFQKKDPQGFYNFLHKDMRNDKSLWTRVCLPHKVTYIPDYQYDLYNIHDRISGKNNTIDMAFVVVFRGGAKSSIKVFSVIHNLCYRLEAVQVLLSESEGQAEKDIIEMEDELMHNKVLLLLYGQLTGDKNPNVKKFTQTQFETIYGDYVIGCGWKTRIRGIRWKGRRPTLVLPDDFESETNTKTDTARNDIIQWITAQIIPLGSKHLKIMFSNTIVHPDSFMALMQSKYNDGSAPFDDDRTIYYERAISTNMLTGDNPVWEKMFNKEWIIKKKKFYAALNRLWFFYQEYYNIPGAGDMVRFDMSKLVEVDISIHNIKRFTWLENKTPDNKIQYLYVRTYSGTDPTSTVTSTSDPLCHLTLAITPTDFALILDIDIAKIKIEDQPKHVHKLNWLYKVHTNTIETYGYQLALEQYVKKEMIDKREPYIVKPFNENISKSKKYIVGIVPRWNSGKIGYIKGCRNIDILKSQAIRFRGLRSGKDDALDGLFLALLNAMKPPNVDVKKRLNELKRMKKH